MEKSFNKSSEKFLQVEFSSEFYPLEIDPCMGSIDLIKPLSTVLSSAIDFLSNIKKIKNNLSNSFRKNLENVGIQTHDQKVSLSESANLPPFYDKMFYSKMFELVRLNFDLLS